VRRLSRESQVVAGDRPYIPCMWTVMGLRHLFRRDGERSSVDAVKSSRIQQGSVSSASMDLPLFDVHMKRARSKSRVSIGCALEACHMNHIIVKPLSRRIKRQLFGCLRAE